MYAYRYSRDKLDTPVDAPDILDLSPYISPTAAASGAQLKAMARSRRSSQDQLQTADTTQQPASDSNRATPAPEATATHSAAPAGHLAGGDRSSMAGAPPVAAAEATPSQPQSEMLYQQLPASVPEERVEGGQRYQLFAIVNHYGSLGGGHYTANAKDPATGRYVVCEGIHLRSEQFRCWCCLLEVVCLAMMSANEHQPAEVLQQFRRAENLTFCMLNTQASDDP